MDEDPLIPVFMPALVVLLTNLEGQKRSPLTEDEVLDIRDRGACVMLPRSTAAKLAATRGYDDIDPESAWQAWQVFRDSLGEAQVSD